MEKLRVTHLSQHFDGWYLRFSGDTEAFDEMRDELKAHGRSYAKWTPGYEWLDDGKRGAWWIDDHLLCRVYADWFSNLDEALQALCTSPDAQWTARRRATARKPPTQAARRAVPVTLMREYALLEIEATATPKDVQSAYRQLAKRYHPDTGGTHEAFLALTQAYERVNRFIRTQERIAS